MAIHLTPTDRTGSGPSGKTSGSCPNAVRQRATSSSRVIGSGARPTQPIGRPAASPNGSERSSPSSEQISALLPISACASSGRW